MTNLPRSSGPPESAADIEAAALAWAARADRDPLSEQEQAELAAWADADPRRAGAYARALAANAYFDRAAALGPGFRPRSRALDRRRLLAVGAGGLLAASIAVGVGLGVVSGQDRIVTPKGDIRRVSLPEGSAVTLNTDTAITPDFGSEVRRIRLLKGEALFDVAKDADRPFVVVAGEVQVRAVGTSFTVRRREDGAVEVAVREGIVEVRRRGGAASVRLVAQTTARVPAAGVIAKAAAPAETLDRAMAWRDGRIDLAGLTLGQAADEFRRYSDREILIDDPSVAALRVAGVYSVSDPEGFARAAALSLGLTATPTREGVRLDRPRPS